MSRSGLSEVDSESPALLARARQISLLLLDVDGILTDGAVTYTEGGEEIKAFHIQDGLGLKLIQRVGMEVGLITARSSEIVRRRAAELGLRHVYQGARDKLAVYERLLDQEKLGPAAVAYMGDDWLDLPVLTRVGFAATVADAVFEVRERVHYVASRPGGRGAVREVCDLLLAARGAKEELLAEYLR